MCNKSGTSEHLGAAKIILAMASRNSDGHSLLCGEGRLSLIRKTICCKLYKILCDCLKTQISIEIEHSQHKKWFSVVYYINTY